MILIIDCGSSKTYKIKEIAVQLGYVADIKPKNKITDIDFNKYSKIIISGGPTLLTNDKEYFKEFLFIKSLSKPVLGICLGHQIIGLLYGAQIFSYKAISGDMEIEILQKDKLFDSLSQNPIFKEDHREFIDLPNDFLLLAKSNTCINEVMKHKTKPIYGVQFHPEISNENGIKILKNFFKL